MLCILLYFLVKSDFNFKNYNPKYASEKTLQSFEIKHSPPQFPGVLLEPKCTDPVLLHMSQAHTAQRPGPCPLPSLTFPYSHPKELPTLGI